jgi:hypothetical protein
VPKSQFAFSIRVNQHGCTYFSFGLLNFVQWLDENGWEFLEIEIELLVFSHDFEHCLISFKNTRKERISIWINLNFDVGNVGFHSQSINLEVDNFVASQGFDISVIVHILHFDGDFMVKKETESTSEYRVFQEWLSLLDSVFEAGIVKGVRLHFKFKIIISYLHFSLDSSILISIRFHDNRHKFYFYIFMFSDKE